MSLSQQLTRLARNVGAITADTNAIFEALRAKGVNVPANAQLSDVADMIETIEVTLPTVNIGGRDYPYVQIGNYLWLAENLDLNVGTNFQYPGHPEYGRYYYDSSTSFNPFHEITAQLPEGWRIPSSSDFETLIQTASPNSGIKLKSTTGWTSGTPGTDEFGFNAHPYGRYYSNSGWSTNNQAQYWTSDSAYYDPSVGWVRSMLDLDLEDIAEVLVHFIDKFYHSIRLVKDVPGFVTIGGRQYKTVTIGNQEWLAENLDYKFQVNGSQIPVGGSESSSNPHAWYYDNNEASYGIDGTYKCGLLYNWYAAKYLDDNKSTLLPSGWHVPSKNEWDTLINRIGNEFNKLKAKTNSIIEGFPPDTWNGDSDPFNFALLPAGTFYLGYGYEGFSTAARLWTSDDYDDTLGYLIKSARSSSLFDYDGKQHGMSLRLVRTIS